MLRLNLPRRDYWMPRIKAGHDSRQVEINELRLAGNRQSAVHEKPPPTAIVSPVIQPEAVDSKFPPVAYLQTTLYQKASRDPPWLMEP